MNKLDEVGMLLSRQSGDTCIYNKLQTTGYIKKQEGKIRLYQTIS